ncbi:RNA 2'-phosphotransferase, partial [Trichormus azollae]|jgi:putative RNA 2'-phosphotransferase
MSRHHVHLSSDISTARIVGKSHVKLFIFTVYAGVMYVADYIIYCSDSGV